jgi:hypothetical protein
LLTFASVQNRRRREERRRSWANRCCMSAAVPLFSCSDYIVYVGGWNSSFDNLICPSLRVKFLPLDTKNKCVIFFSFFVVSWNFNQIRQKWSWSTKHSYKPKVNFTARFYKIKNYIMILRKIKKSKYY